MWTKHVYEKSPAMKLEIFSLQGPRLRRVTSKKSKNGTNDDLFRDFPSNQGKCCISNLILTYKYSYITWTWQVTRDFFIVRPEIEEVLSAILL